MDASQKRTNRLRAIGKMLQVRLYRSLRNLPVDVYRRLSVNHCNSADVGVATPGQLC